LSRGPNAGVIPAGAGRDWLQRAGPQGVRGTRRRRPDGARRRPRGTRPPVEPQPRRPARRAALHLAGNDHHAASRPEHAADECRDGAPEPDIPERCPLRGGQHRFAVRRGRA